MGFDLTQFNDRQRAKRKRRQRFQVRKKAWFDHHLYVNGWRIIEDRERINVYLLAKEDYAKAIVRILNRASQDGL